MDNYRKHYKRRPSSTSVDGFVRRQPARVRTPSMRGAESKPIKKTVDRPVLGNFRRTEGLHVAAQGDVGFAGDKRAAGKTGRRPARDAKGRIKLSAAPKSAPKKRRSFGQALKRTTLTLMALMLVGGTYLGVKAYMKGRKILAGGGSAAALQENVDPSKLNREGDGRINILLLGKGGLGHEAPDLTDTILIASIDPINKEAGLVSIPRDLYVRTSDAGSMKINAVYVTAKNKVLNGQRISNQRQKAEEAGFKAIEDTVEEVLGIPIHYHAMVDFTGFKKAIDAVGGVDLTVSKPVYEVMHIDGKRYTLNVPTGRQHFDGFRALAYARSRKTSARGDFDRAERQRLILVALKNKVLSLGTLSNPLKVNELLDALGDHVQTNFSINEMMQLYEIGKHIDSDSVESIGLSDPPNDFLTTGNIGGLSVVVPRAGLNDYDDIHMFIRNRLRDAYLKKEDATVTVLNGTTTPGLASRVADKLKSYGYRVTNVDDAPSKDYRQTVLFDLKSGQHKYTRHYLQKRLETTAENNLPDGLTAPEATDFVIIVGTNEITRLGRN